MKNPEEYDASSTAMNPGNSAPGVVWLASDESMHVTGQVLRMVGNNLARLQAVGRWASSSSRPTRTATATQWDPADIGRILNRYRFETMNPGIDAQRRA